MNRAVRGFTMVELVVSLSIASIVVAMVTLFLTAPMDTYLAQNRRSGLTDAAYTTQRLLAEDVASALPNSLRTRRNGNVVVMEMLKVSDSARYRENGSAGGNTTRELQITAPDAQFATLGTSAGTWRALTLPYDSSVAYLVIDHLATPGFNAYALANVITPPNTRIQISNAALNEAQVTLTPAFRFAADSPTHRIFLVEGPVAYLCDEGAQTLTRYSGYGIASNLASRDSAAELLGAGATAALVANQISTCEAWTRTGLSPQRDLLGVFIQFANNAERLRLFQQFTVQALP